MDSNEQPQELPALPAEMISEVLTSLIIVAYQKFAEPEELISTIDTVAHVSREYYGLTRRIVQAMRHRCDTVLEDRHRKLMEERARNPVRQNLRDTLADLHQQLQAMRNVMATLTAAINDDRVGIRDPQTKLYEALLKCYEDAAQSAESDADIKDDGKPAFTTWDAELESTENEPSDLIKKKKKALQKAKQRLNVMAWCYQIE